MIQVGLKEKLAVCAWLGALCTIFLFGDAVHGHQFQWSDKDYCASCVLNISNLAENTVNTPIDLVYSTHGDIYRCHFHDHYHTAFFFLIDIPRAPPA